MLAALLAAALSSSCTGDLVGPPAAERDPGSPAVELPQPATAPRGPGFLTVEWTAPAAGRAIGVLLELEGPGIEAVAGAAGLAVYHSAASGRHRIVVAGPLESGPLLRFLVPDRGRLALYRVRVLQVTGEDYGLRETGEYLAVITPHSLTTSAAMSAMWTRTAAGDLRADPGETIEIAPSRNTVTIARNTQLLLATTPSYRARSSTATPKAHGTTSHRVSE